MKLIATAQTKLCCLIIGVCFLFFLTGEANPFFAYNHQNFHIWQLISAHIVHYDFQHLIKNMLALVLLLYLFPSSTINLIKGLTLAVTMIDIYLIFSDIQFYTGFSGLLYVIPGIALGRYIQNKQYFYVFLILIIALIYTLAIQHKNIINDEIVWTPLLQAHLIGFFSGAIIHLSKLHD